MNRPMRPVEKLRSIWNGEYILLPADFTWRDETTFLIHQGAMWVRPEPEGDRGRVIGFTTLCTEHTTPRWKEKPVSPENVVTCFGCLGATEQ